MVASNPAFLEKSLTRPGRPSRVIYMEDALPAMVSQLLGGRTVREGAQLCGIHEHLIRDIVYKKTRRPAPETLQAIAHGLGGSYERLALAAYGIIHEAVLV